MVRLFLLLIIQLPFWVNGQTIRHIYIDGLTRTSPEFLEQILYTKGGQIYDSTQLNQDVQFLRNLPLYSGISYQVDISNDSVDIRLNLQENFTILPSLGVGLIESAPFIQLGVNDYNFLGRMTQLSVNYTWYDRHSFQIFYHNRFIGQGNFGITGNLEKRSTLEPLYFADTSADYQTDKYIAEILPGYNINHFIYAQAGVALLQENYTTEDISTIDGTGLPSKLDTLKWLFKGVVTVDKRFYQSQYVGGWSSQLFIEGLPKGNEPMPFMKLFSETKWYGYKNKWNYAGRWRMGVSTNLSTPFPPFVVDSYINLRGSGNRIARGSAELTLNQELRYTIYEWRHSAIQGVAFIDAGTWRPAGGEWPELLDTDYMLAFGGLGGRLYLQKFYNLFLRADYGINPIDPVQRGLVMGIGQYF